VTGKICAKGTKREMDPDHLSGPKRVDIKFATEGKSSETDSVKRKEIKQFSNESIRPRREWSFKQKTAG